MSYLNFRERIFAHLVRALLRGIPKRYRLGIAKTVFDFDSPRVRGFDAVVCYGRKQKFSLKTKDYIDWRIYFTGVHERETDYALSCICKPGDTVRKQVG